MLDKLAAVLMEFNMHVMHVPGKKMQAPDALSQAGYDMAEYEQEPEYIGCLHIKLTLPGDTTYDLDSEDRSENEDNMSKGKVDVVYRDVRQEKMSLIINRKTKRDRVSVAAMRRRGKRGKKTLAEENQWRRMAKAGKGIEGMALNVVTRSKTVEKRRKKKEKEGEDEEEGESGEEKEEEERSSSSTPPMRGLEPETQVDYLPGLHPLVELARLSIYQRGDIWLRMIIDRLEQGKLPEDKKMEAKIRRVEERYFLDKTGLLRWNDVVTAGMVISLAVVPEQLIPLLLEYMHEDPIAGHLRIKKTYHRIRERFYFDGLYSEVREHIRTCKSCQVNKPAMRPDEELEGVDDTYINFPGMTVQIDFTVAQRTERGNQYVCNILDRFTRFSMFSATKIVNAAEVVYLLMEYISIFGCPVEIISDNGREFNNKLIKSLCMIWVMGV